MTLAEMVEGNKTGNYCSLRNSRRRNFCLIRPVVKTVTRERHRQGRVEIVHLYLCEYHAKIVKD